MITFLVLSFYDKPIVKKYIKEQTILASFQMTYVRNRSTGSGVVMTTRHKMGGGSVIFQIFEPIYPAFGEDVVFYFEG